MYKFCHKKFHAYLGIGSNLGNKIQNFNKCLKLIEELNIGKVIKTSQLYESPCLDENSKIVPNENKFLNSVIKIQTDLSPVDLLIKCKEIESKFKRNPKEKYYEAREIDLDILTYDNKIINTNEPFTLQIPHKRLYNRLFVLKPLMDIDPNLKIFNWKSGREESLLEIFNNIEKTKLSIEELNKKESINYLNKAICFNEKFYDLSKKNFVMGIFNCTPDSFSGGLIKDKTNTTEYNKIFDEIVKNKDYLDIIDIGGESTRPGSCEVEPNEEFDRIAPLIKLIKESKDLQDKIISIDTRKSYVANESIKLGSDIINDVSGGRFDAEIINVVSRTFTPYICMHSRGEPGTMMNPEYLDYNNNLIKTIELELTERINRMKFQSSILDWNIILDPGLGFSKNFEQNIEIVQNLDKFKSSFSNALLLGHSRKRFIQQILKVPATETLIGNVVIANYGFMKGANMVRVHDYKQTAESLLINNILNK
jgi:dihydropteroate synthase/2-amino-4-hydroxy-6-hydroxymethyldihydropteridine diphosphokinase